MNRYIVIAIVTDHPRFYHQAVKELKKKELQFVSLKIGEKIPPDVDVVITSPGERAFVDFHEVVASENPEDAIRGAQDVRKGVKAAYEKLYIGVDPGKRVGLAVMADARIVHEEILNKPEDIEQSIIDIEKRFSPAKIILRVGSAGGAYRDRAIASVQAHFDHAIEIVNEDSTSGSPTDRKRLGLHKDLMAARNIVFKKGKPLKKTVVVRTTPGEIKNIQRESRQRSDNLTISKELARAVAIGELELEEAIRIQRKRLNEDIHTAG